MATIKELARELNLSTATVSMALRGSKLISAATTKRVAQLAAARHYVPNNFGRGLQSRRSRLIGALIGSATASFWSELIERAGFAAAERGYGFLTGWAHDSAGELEAQIRLLLEKSVDGFLLMLPYEQVLPQLKWLTGSAKPFVFCSHRCPPEYSSVLNDDFVGGAKIVTHLIECGHRHILGCDRLPERYRGFQAAADAAGVELAPFRYSAEVPALLAARPQVTAIAAFADHQAIRIRHLLTATERRVPEDISLTGYDDLWFAGLPEFDFTTVAQQKAVMGELAIAQLLAQIDGASAPKRLLLEPALVRRSSVRSLTAASKSSAI